MSAESAAAWAAYDAARAHTDEVLERAGLAGLRTVVGAVLERHADVAATTGLCFARDGRDCGWKARQPVATFGHYPDQHRDHLADEVAAHVATTAEAGGLL